MPYIPQIDRDDLDLYSQPKNSGELNYCLTKLVLQFLYRNGNPRYQDMNDALGALEGCKLELYRRVVAPYEGAKRRENGDVYVSE